MIDETMILSGGAGTGEIERLLLKESARRAASAAVELRPDYSLSEYNTAVALREGFDLGYLSRASEGREARWEFINTGADKTYVDGTMILAKRFFGPGAWVCIVRLPPFPGEEP